VVVRRSYGFVQVTALDYIGQLANIDLTYIVHTMCWVEEYRIQTVTAALGMASPSALSRSRGKASRHGLQAIFSLCFIFAPLREVFSVSSVRVLGTCADADFSIGSALCLNIARLNLT
jgi:hypothetical protein